MLYSIRYGHSVAFGVGDNVSREHKLSLDCGGIPARTVSITSGKETRVLSLVARSARLLPVRYLWWTHKPRVLIK